MDDTVHCSSIGVKSSLEKLVSLVLNGSRRIFMYLLLEMQMHDSMTNNCSFILKGKIKKTVRQL
ncbi:hypothetical protein [Neobacillus jeddahensis]|uniref:hypothetical protein n=1 Tax=Neobacillus jeddahensis TaxID=1461580 RepID=UPI00058C8D55|nr:hypothetical protein [Neobacillus jeddahensis]